MSDRRQRLRKQPKLRRVHVTGSAALPHVVVPKTAKKRRRRNNKSLQLPVAAIKRIVASARWISLALLGVFVGALFLIGSYEDFYLTTIPVDGVTSIPPAEIVASSGLAGTHIFAADPSEAAKRIGEIPGVISTTVILTWPNQVSIHVTEDSPIAIWEQSGKRYWINANGQLIPARAATNGLLRIESETSAGDSELGFVPDDVLEGALLLRRLRPNIDLLYYRPGNGLSFQDGRGWRVYFGSGLDMAQKLAVYETLVEELLGQGQALSYVSVANQAKPYYMPAAN